MAEKEQEEQDGADEQNAKSKESGRKDWAAADLEKVTDFNEENDDGKKVSNEKLDSFLTGSREHKQEVKKINIRKEDVQLIMDELELPRIRAEKKLIEHNGDFMAAAKDLLGFS